MLHEIQAEILARGPVTCYMWAHSAGFDHYTGGVIVDPTKYNGTTHAISIVGWGEEETAAGTSIPYWHIRNSFGTYWGEQGFFRVSREYPSISLSLSLPLECSFGHNP